MLEDKLDALTVQMKRVGDLLEKGGTISSDASAKPAAKAGAKAAAKPKHTVEQVKAKILEVKEQHDMDRAKQVISDAGGDDLADLLTKPNLFDKAFTLAEEALAEAADDEGGDDSGL